MASHLVPDNFITRTEMKPLEGNIYRIKFSDCRVHDALGTVLPNTPASDDFGVTTNTFGTAGTFLETPDLKTLGGQSCYFRFHFTLPPHFDPEGTSTFNIKTRTSAVADVSSMLTVVGYEISGGQGVGERIAADPTDINASTPATNSFPLITTSLVGGDILDVRVLAAVDDGSGASPVVVRVYDMYFSLCTRG
jgi:hypothetical protein